MKFIIIILFLFSLLVFAKGYEKPTLMLKLNSKNVEIDENIKIVIRMGIGEVLTDNGYVLISESNQKIALEEMKKQNETDCLDDACLVDTGGMLAAKGIFVVDIAKLGSKYVFEIKHIDIQSASVLKTKSDVYQNEIDDADFLLPFSKEIARTMFTSLASKDDGTASSLRANGTVHKGGRSTATTVTDVAVLHPPKEDASKSDDNIITQNIGGQNIGTQNIGAQNIEPIQMKKTSPEDYYKLGVAFEEHREMKRANKFYLKACSLNYAKACNSLGYNYKYGEGCDKDIVTANDYYIKACKLNNENSCYNLGNAYLYGLGFNVNKVKALFFYKRACELGLNNSICKKI
jgi:hypothetical protein